MVLRKRGKRRIVERKKIKSLERGLYIVMFDGYITWRSLLALYKTARALHVLFAGFKIPFEDNKFFHVSTWLTWMSIVKASSYSNDYLVRCCPSCETPESIYLVNLLMYANEVETAKQMVRNLKIEPEKLCEAIMLNGGTSMFDEVTRSMSSLDYKEYVWKLVDRQEIPIHSNQIYYALDFGKVCTERRINMVWYASVSLEKIYARKSIVAFEYFRDEFLNMIPSGPWSEEGIVTAECLRALLGRKFKHNWTDLLKWQYPPAQSLARWIREDVCCYGEYLHAIKGTL